MVFFVAISIQKRSAQQLRFILRFSCTANDFRTYFNFSIDACGRLYAYIRVHNLHMISLQISATDCIIIYRLCFFCPSFVPSWCCLCQQFRAVFEFNERVLYSVYTEHRVYRHCRLRDTRFASTQSLRVTRYKRIGTRFKLISCRFALKSSTIPGIRNKNYYERKKKNRNIFCRN